MGGGGGGGGKWGEGGVGGINCPLEALGYVLQCFLKKIPWWKITGYWLDQLTDRMTNGHILL